MKRVSKLICMLMAFLLLALSMAGCQRGNSNETDDKTLVIHYPRAYYAYLSDFCWPDVMPIVPPEVLIDGDFQTVKGIIGTVLIMTR